MLLPLGSVIVPCTAMASSSQLRSAGSAADGSDGGSSGQGDAAMHDRIAPYDQSWQGLRRYWSKKDEAAIAEAGL
jgi:hypothetical protein